MRRRTSITAFGAAALAALGTQPMMAQAVEGDSQSQETELASVTVTAQKRPENLQRVPISIVTFNESSLREQRIQTPSDLALNVPGFTILATGTSFTPFIRGLGSKSGGAWQEPTVSTYIDGVYYADTNATKNALNSVASVEVVRGPQGTLFGRNAVGGLIAYQTKDPQHTPQMNVQAGYGNYDTWTGSLYATTGITDSLAADIAIFAEDQSEGWGKNLYTGLPVGDHSDYSARSKWVLNPSDSTKFTLIGDWGRNYFGNAYALARGVYPSITTGPVHVGSFYDAYAPGDEFSDRPFTEVSNYGVSLKVEHDLGWAQLISISAGRKVALTSSAPYAAASPYLPATPAVGQPAGLKTSTYTRSGNDYLTQELQLQSPEASKVEWVAGAFVFIQDADLGFRTDRRATSPVLTIMSSLQKTESYSAFAQATVPVADNTRLTLGARYSVDTRSVSGGNVRNSVANPAVFTPITGQQASDNPDPRHTWSNATYKGVLEHDFNDDVMGYVSLSSGFQSGYYNLSSPQREPLDPVTIIGYEAGVKSILFDNRLRLNTSLFFYDIKDIIVTHNEAGLNIQDNAASSESKGVDVDITFAATRNLTTALAFEYLDPKYTDFRNAVGYAPNATGTYSNVVYDATGRQLQYTQKFTATASATYKIPVSSGEFSLTGAASRQGDQPYDDQGLNVQPAHTLLNASASWTSLDERTYVELWGKNLTNEETAGFLPLTVVMLYNARPPRTYGVSVGYHW